MSSTDRQAEFTRLLAENRGQLFGYLYALVQNLDDTEELFQETTLLLWEKFDQFQPGSNFAAWACKTGQLLCCNFLRRKGRSRVAFDDDVVRRLATVETETPPGEAAQRQNALAGCLEKLRRTDRRIVRLCYEGKSPIKQIAEREKCTAEALYMRLSRIRRSLFRCIDRTLANQQRAT